MNNVINKFLLAGDKLRQPYTYNIKDLNDEEIIGSFMTENYKRLYYKMSYYPPYKSSSNDIKVELVMQQKLI